uniref:Uncharacterized protein n=1 Tax=viral metagenome TaxID=1070528 RepID=A0A6C0KDW7_9ZZZZ
MRTPVPVNPRLRIGRRGRNVALPCFVIYVGHRDPAPADTSLEATIRGIHTALPLALRTYHRYLDVVSTLPPGWWVLIDCRRRKVRAVLCILHMAVSTDQGYGVCVDTVNVSERSRAFLRKRERLLAPFIKQFRETYLAQQDESRTGPGRTG